MQIKTRDEYDKLNSYEPMMYRPENWEQYNNNQEAAYAIYAEELNTQGFIRQIGKTPFLSYKDFLTKREKTESREGFTKWIENKDVSWPAKDTTN